jgi:hypothetical protein
MGTMRVSRIDFKKISAADGRPYSPAIHIAGAADDRAAAKRKYPPWPPVPKGRDKPPASDLRPAHHRPGNIAAANHACDWVNLALTPGYKRTRGFGKSEWDGTHNLRAKDDPEFDDAEREAQEAYAARLVADGKGNA